MELVEGIPFGLAICEANGAQVTITAISDRRLCVRLCENARITSLRLRFLQLRGADWRTVVPKSWHEEEREEGRYGFEARIEIDDADYRAEVLRILNEFAAYIRLKSQDDDAALMEELTGYAPCADISATFEEQKRRWFARDYGDFEAPDLELAISIDRPERYARFLQMPFEAFQRDFFRRNRLEAHPMFARSAARTYIGNAHCFRLLPNALTPLLERCAEQNLRATVVLPPVSEERRGDLERVLKEIGESAADEIAANDWGTLTLLKNSGRAVLLGTQLNRRRKDPRIEWKAGYARDAALLRENNLNDPRFVDFLHAWNVRRFEYEACIVPVKVAAGRHSLHLPFFQTNTSTGGCPLAKVCAGGDAGLPHDERTCAMPCGTHALLYPDAARMVGRGNSLFGLDARILEDAQILRTWMEQGVDRIVAELL